MKTVAELIVELQALPQDAIVVQSRDAEGNGFSPTALVDIGRYEAETTWSGTVGLDKLTEEDIEAGYSEADVPDGPICVCFWPVN